MKGSNVFASIDIGTNAIRLLFYNIYHDLNGIPTFKKMCLTRVPIRLGEDVFLTNKISDKKIELLRKTLIAYRHLIDVNNTLDYLACATSAMREAENAEEVIKYLYKETGIKIKTITGEMEANLIFQNHVAEKMDPNNAYLYIDVGGGSTEITLYHEGEKRLSQSFKVGTVRMLCNKVSDNTWEILKLKCIDISQQYKSLIGIGSGGSIIKLQKLSDENKNAKLSRSKLKKTLQALQIHSVEERMRVFGLNPDRADIIVLAAEIFLFIMKYTEIESIIVPKMGLSDGIIHYMYEQYVNNEISDC